jgi:uncharacterized protein
VDASGVDLLDLLDWKRTISELYATVRADLDSAAAWKRWRDQRDRLFATHPQSPLPPAERASFSGLPYFDYDPELRTHADVRASPAERLEIATSTGGTHAFTRFGTTTFSLRERPLTLAIYWLEAYGGGAFLSFRDATSGRESYGACRYLLDTVKGADLGGDGRRLVLDFNFAYNPSCAYDPRWTCPLAPPDNHLPVAIEAGERAPRAAT